MMKTSGIYKIINKFNGKYYVGSSKNIKYRWTEHVCDLNAGHHDNDYLQKSWNKHGKESFDFVVVEEVPQELLLIIEQKYLDTAKTDGEQSYNLRFDTLRGLLTPYSRMKISDANRKRKGYKHTDATRLKISNSMKGKTLSPITKTKCGNASKKYWTSLA